MLFLLRSAFWLGLVFMAAPGAADDPRRESGARAASAAVLAAGDMASGLPGQVETACRKAPKECLAMAQKLAAAPVARHSATKPATQTPQRDARRAERALEPQMRTASAQDERSGR